MRIREGLGLCIVLMGSCDESYDSVLDVLSFTDGTSAVDVRRFEPRRDLRFESPLGTVDLDEDGAEEVLLSSNEGLLWLRADGTRPTLWRGDSIRAVEWAEPTSRHGALILMLLEHPPGRGLLVQLACSSGPDPACREVNRSEADPHATAIAVADMDEDGAVDVLTLGEDRVALLRGTVSADGEVSWPSRERFGDSNHRGLVPDLEVADLDEDGHIDVVAAQDLGFGGLRVYFGDGAGSWDAVDDLTSASCLLRSAHIEAVDDDALPDIVLYCGEPMVVLNLGAREFEIVRPTSEIEADEMLLGRFGGNGLSWFVWSYDDGTASLIHPAYGTTETTTSISVPIDDAVYAYGIVADLDGDNMDEIVFVTTGFSAGCG
jgi:hypothetical protein